MRVIAGKARRRILKTMEGLNTRPTTDRIKETLFNMLSFEIEGSRFLDLFSGSGAIGIEALSRGAREAVFVENNRKAIDCIRDNLRTTGLEEDALVIPSDAVSAIRRMGKKEEPFDLIFMDPPYGKELEKEVLYAMSEYPSLFHEDTLIIVESDLKTEFSYLPDTPFTLVREKKYKTNKHSFLRVRENK